MPTARTFFASALLAACLLLAAGCSNGDRPPLGEVSGTVTMDGQPMQNVIVMFTPEAGGRPAAATTDAEGKYQLEYLYDIPGAKLGPNRVSFEWPMGQVGPPIPARYGAKSELHKEVEDGENHFDFALESK